jgi:acyl dehydratase
MTATNTTAEGTPVQYYDEFAIGDEVVTPGRTVTEGDVVNFAALTGDYASIHTDAEFAAASGFGQRVAHGLLGLTFAQGLVWRVTSPYSARLASLAWTNWSFHAPIAIGDTIHVTCTVTATRRSSSNPSRAVITERLEIINQHGAVVQSGEHLTLVPVRGEGTA